MKTTKEQLARSAGMTLAATDNFQWLPDEKLMEMIKMLATSIGLRVVNRRNLGDQDLNLFISSGSNFQFGDFRNEFLNSCRVGYSVPQKAEVALEAIERAITLLLQAFGQVEVEGLGIFEIKMIPVWSFQAGEGLSLPPRVLEKKTG